MPQASTQNLVSRINSLMREVGSTKQATELGLTGSAKVDGESTHPSAKVENNLQAPSLGELAHDNEKRIKEDQPAGGVDSAAKNETGTHDSKAISVGIKPSATGEDPSTEDNYKDKKDDPGTSHPAEAGEEKYGSMRLPELCKLANAKLEAVLSDFEKEEHLNYYGEVLAKRAAARASAQATPESVKRAAEAGQQAAQAVVSTPSFDKKAYAQQILAEELYKADHAADLVGLWLKKTAEFRKASAEADPMSVDAGNPEEKGEGSVDKSPPTKPEDMGGADLPAGAVDPMAAMAGAGAEAGGETGGGDPTGSGEPNEAAVNELFNALAQLGIPPEALLQAAQHAESGPGGGMPPADVNGVDVPKMASAIHAGGKKFGFSNVSELRKYAAAACRLQASGKARLVRRAPGTKEANERNEIVRYLEEMCGVR